ncbi:MAG: hypothetical protein NUV59_00880 [Patescibacteria group bacterium]|nr:hypothetical protein [Patescibacteria group bacterium]
MTKAISARLIAVATLAALLSLGFVSLAFAGHNGAVVGTDVQTCSPTTISASIANPAGTHKVGNMWLTVDDGSTVQTGNIPTDGSGLSFEVGPFGIDTTVSWNVFGGGERSYDQPLWNGFGTPSFSSDISAYASSVGTFSWVIAGVDDPNPFVNWNEVEVPACAPEVKNDCKNGGWEDFGFKNQGQCVRFAETGKDSR